MPFSSSTQGASATVFLEGSLSFRSYPDFKAATHALVDDPAISQIRLDLSAVGYLDSSALGMILHLKQKTDAASMELVLLRPSTQVDSILKVVNFAKFLKIEA